MLATLTTQPEAGLKTASSAYDCAPPTRGWTAHRWFVGRGSASEVAQPARALATSGDRLLDDLTRGGDRRQGLERRRVCRHLDVERRKRLGQRSLVRGL